jgi:hypothetical protein
MDLRAGLEVSSSRKIVKLFSAFFFGVDRWAFLAPEVGVLSFGLADFPVSREGVEKETCAREKTVRISTTRRLEVKKAHEVLRPISTEGDRTIGVVKLFRSSGYGGED